jgi:hypothetical protein
MRASSFLPVAFVAFCLLAACGGGGGGGVTFTLVAIAPDLSDDLAGGDTVTITGTNFMAVQVTSVTFGGVLGTNLVVVSDTTIEVQTPPSPGGIARTVTVQVTSSSGGVKALSNAYTYQNTTPQPASINPVSFTPTGAGSFTITGSTLGAPNGQVTVVFQGIGSVAGTVSADATSVTGRAPVTAGVPPVGPVTVTVDTGNAQVDVPTTVSYAFTPPSAIPFPLPGQAQGNASQPVRLADGYAILCTAGPNGTWGNADDEIFIIQGPPNIVAAVQVRPRGTLTPVGYLSAANSIPAVLDADTFCVYTVGPPGAGPGFLVITLARTNAPVADLFGHPGILAAPIARIGTARIAFLAAGGDGLVGPAAGGNTGDDIFILDLNLTVAPPTAAPPAPPLLGAIFADVATGVVNFSTPFSSDGDTVIAMSVGPNGVPRDGDDTFAAITISNPGLAHAPTAAPHLRGRPIAVSATSFAAPGAGAAPFLFGDGNDTLEVFNANAGTWTRTPYTIGSLNTTALVPYAPSGDGIAMPVTLPAGIRIHPDLTGSNASFAFTGVPLLAALGSGGLIVFGPGGDLTPRAGNDDQARYIDPDAIGIQTMSLVPDQPQTLMVLTDATRAFGLSPGSDNTWGTADDTLEVYQTRSIDASRNGTQLPVSALPARVSGTVPFVPIGPNWGLLQSPGMNTTFGDADDQLILATY